MGWVGPMAIDSPDAMVGGWVWACCGGVTIGVTLVPSNCHSGKPCRHVTCILDFLLGFVTHVSGSTIQQCNIAETVHHQRSHYRTTRSTFGDDALLQLD